MRIVIVRGAPDIACVQHASDHYAVKLTEKDVLVFLSGVRSDGGHALDEREQRRVRATGVRQAQLQQTKGRSVVELATQHPRAERALLPICNTPTPSIT